MNAMILVIKGSQSGSIIEVTVEEADKAEKQGWAQKIDGRDPLSYTHPEPRAPHKEADTFLSKKFGYTTSELRPQETPSKAAQPDQGQDDGEEEKPEEEDTKTTKTSKRK